MGDILFLVHRIPYPPDRGDKIRSFNILKYLSARKRVHLITFADDPNDLKHKAGLVKYTGNRSIIWRAKTRARAAMEALLTRRPISITAFEHDALRDAVSAILARHAIDTIFVFSSQMAQYLPANPRQKVIMDFVDMDSAKFEAYADSSKGPMRWMMRREAKLLLQHERAVANRADASLFVSEAEAQLFRDKTGADRVHAVENGIDTAFFDPAAKFKRVDTIGHSIVFTGQMDYRPNVEGVVWFVETILPHILIEQPEARFMIVGRNPTDAVRALGKYPAVTVVGEVADVRSWLSQASVVVAPLKMARGIQNKVLEGMAMGRPVVASEAAAEGIDHGGTIRVGETVADIANAICEILRDRHVAKALGESGRQRVIERYSWNARLAPLDAVLGLPVRDDKLERTARAVDVVKPARQKRSLV